MTRKTKLYLALAGLSVLFLLMLGVGIMWVAQGGLPLNLSDDPVFQERYDGVESVACALRSYAIEVRTWEGPDVEVSFYRWGLGGGELPETRVENGRLTVTEPWTLGLLLGGGKVVVQVPAGTAMPYELRTVSGSVKLDAPCTTAALETTSGSVKVYRSGAALTARTVSGSIKVYEPFPAQDLRTTSGSVKAAADAGTEEVRMQTVSGSIKLQLEGITGYRLEHHVTSGSVRDEYRNIRYEQDGTDTWGDGSLWIHASTTSGSIKLTDWGD